MARADEHETGSSDSFARRLVDESERPDHLAPTPEVAHLARARWVIIFVLFLYGVYAGIFYAFSRFGFFLTEGESSFLFLGLCSVIIYNLAYQSPASHLSRFRYGHYLQVLLDLLLVTVLIHYSGGAVSWVWTLYLMVSMEAVYLLKRPAEVWLAWCTNAVLYGGLLACEHSGTVAAVPMPFVDPVLRNDTTFLFLIWMWVVMVNAAVTAIGFRLMSVSRREKLQLLESRERLFAFLEHADDLIQLNAPDGSFLYANRAWLRAMGYRKEELSGLNLFQVLHRDSVQPFGEDFRQVLTDAASGRLEGLYLARDGRTINVEGYLSCSFRGKSPDAVWGICRDVTLKKRADQELYRRAHHDVLTDLPNRQLFMDRLQQLRGMMNRMGLALGVLYLDLDHFKSINDSFGHAFGDKLLQTVAQRLAACVRETDTVARFGGDEFVIAIGNLEDVRGAEIVARKILKALRAPYRIDSRQLLITSSIGISMYPEHGSELDELVEKADMALYSAKEHGRGCYKIYREGRKKGKRATETAVPSSSGSGRLQAG